MPPAQSQRVPQVFILSSGRQLFSPARSLNNPRNALRAPTPRRPRRRHRHPVLREPLLPTPTPPPQPPPHLPSQVIPQSQNQPTTTSSQTTTNTNRQSSSTSTTNLSSLNGIQTQATSRTEEKKVTGSSSTSAASRSELSDRIRSPSRSQANGTVNPISSRSERTNWRRDGSRTPGTLGRGLSRGRGHRVGHGNVNTNQVHTTTQPGTSRYR